MSSGIFKRCILILFLYHFGLPGLATATENIEISADHLCSDCHTANHSRNLAQLAKSIQCTTCHAAPIIKVTTSTPVNENEKSKANGHDPRHPIYSHGTHAGDHPNEMVFVPAGEFTMGTNERLPDEGPEHKVKLPAFWIDKYEVTNAQYKLFIDDTKRKSPSLFKNRTYPENKADHPVTFVTWLDADAYCRWTGKRLPTDQEWEKAARGTDGRIYPWGNHFDTSYSNSPQHWLALGQDGDTMPVGSFEKGVSPYGAYDMSGNVWEWTDSWYQAYPGNTRQTENYGEIYKTLKGGSWWDCSFYKCGMSAPAYNRAFFLKTTKNKSFGFRCAKDAN